MSQLLHIDSSVRGEDSVSRHLTRRAASAWRAANPEGEVIYRDLATDPIPHLDSMVFQTPPDQHTAEQAEVYELGLALAREVRESDAVVLGAPLYNYGAPSTVKAWVDHLMIPGVTFDHDTMTGFLSTPLFVMVARGGGYGPDAPRHGWDHVESWLPHGISLTGLTPQFIVAELTLAHINPAMAELIPLADASLAAAEAEVDALFAPQPA